jgi:hypothetical protein
VFLSFCILACAKGTTDAPAQRSSSVPPQAPDTTPGWFHHDSNIAGNYVKGVVGVIFHEGTSLADRQAAIDKVGGEVVGGWRFTPDREGIYAVKVDDGGDREKLLELMERLDALPQVKSATHVETVSTP